MTVQPTRDQLRADVATGKALTGTHRADSDRDYYPAMKRIFEAVPQLLDQLDQQEAELDSWMTRAYEAEKRAWQAEARVKAVRDLCDARESPDQWPPRNRLHGGALMPASLMVRDIRRALDGDA